MNKTKNLILPKTYEHNLASNFKAFFNSKQFSDVTFKIYPSETIFYSHSLILIVMSGYFRKQFQHEQKNKTIEGLNLFELENVQPTIFEQTLSFCYTGKITLNINNCKTILTLAQRLEIHSLIPICQSYIWKCEKSLTKIFQVELMAGVINEQKNRYYLAKIKKNQKQIDPNKKKENQNQKINEKEKEKEKEKERETNEDEIMLLYENKDAFRIGNGKRMLHDNNHYQKEMIKRKKLKILNTTMKIKPQRTLLLTDKSYAFIQDISTTIMCGQWAGIVTTLRIDEMKLSYNYLFQFDSAVIFLTEHNPAKYLYLKPLLKRYLNDGGGVVMSSHGSFWINTESNKPVITNQIIEKEFLPFVPNCKFLSKPRVTGKKVNLRHPVLNQITTLETVQNSNRWESQKLEKGAKLIAKWGDGNILLAEKSDIGCLLLFNVSFFSNKSIQDSWVKTSSMATLISNAVDYASKYFANIF
ncbi:speckle-type poz protein [Anaeramoeba flamelloides]|uniref:Speckle-type poz protein n=1 Tax=Anaeramoeba flamelloides TaxID=1746091 RepID=A0AAV7ZGE9_9EUKA|nr:speckle-type poz protein [Anaeramoeba flamelloides]